jgi:hypothetical protein
MKNLIYLFVAIIMISSGCKKDNNEISENEQEVFLELLQGTWNTNEVRRDNSLISDFNNFSLTIAGKSYTSENGAPVWPASGTFDFENDISVNGFIRNDNRLFTATENNGVLTITIIYDENTARGEFGTYEFQMEK